MTDQTTTKIDNTDSTAVAVDNVGNSETLSAEQTSTTQQSMPPASVVKREGKAFGVFAMLFSLGALGVSGYHFYLSELSGKNSDSAVLTGVNQIGGDVKVLAERMNQLQRAQRALEQEAVSEEKLQTSLLTVNTNSERALRDVADEQQGLKETLEKLAANNERSADKLALGEVSQLLKMANNSAIFSSDNKSAINALKLADSQLKQLADPRYSVVRRTINSEVTKLEAIELVDVTSLTAELNAIAIRVPKLPLENEPPVADRINIIEPEVDNDLSFTSELKKLWAMTLNTVKISKVEELPKPLLAPQQRYFLDQNIQLKLSTAELAVMQNNAEVYERSIDSVLEWLLDYYDPRDTDVIAVVDKLRSLKGQPLGVELPSVVDSYDQLQRLQGGN